MVTNKAMLGFVALILVIVSVSIVSAEAQTYNVLLTRDSGEVVYLEEEIQENFGEPGRTMYTYRDPDNSMPVFSIVVEPDGRVFYPGTNAYYDSFDGAMAAAKLHLESYSHIQQIGYYSAATSDIDSTLQEEQTQAPQGVVSQGESATTTNEGATVDNPVDASAASQADASTTAGLVCTDGFCYFTSPHTPSDLNLPNSGVTLDTGFAFSGDFQTRFHSVHSEEEIPEGAERISNTNYYIIERPGGIVDYYILSTDEETDQFEPAPAEEINQNADVEQTGAASNLPETIEAQGVTFIHTEGSLYKYTTPNGESVYYDTAAQKYFKQDGETLTEISEESAMALINAPTTVPQPLPAPADPSQPNLKKVLVALSQEYAPAASGWLWLYSLADQKAAQDLRMAFSGDIGLPQTAADFLCQATRDINPNQNTMLGYDWGKMPTLQLQAIRSTPIVYPSNNTNGSVSTQGLVVEPNQTTEGKVLYYTKITLRFENILNPIVDVKDKTYEVYLAGYSESKKFVIDLDPTSEATSLKLNFGSLTMAGRDAIIEYWPVRLDKVCIEFKDPEHILNPKFLQKLRPANMFCTKVVEVKDKWLVYQLMGATGSAGPSEEQGNVLQR
ncbi:hypothetical protein KY318_00165 [Candidatus Woesearchaeota archaeon]|nr:hypothetical protein [Candidatus Woesearchaeota archaeon]